VLGLLLSASGGDAQTYKEATTAERACPKLIYYNKVTKGGHFAAWEQPQLIASELRAAFRSCAREELPPRTDRGKL
jgi:hypothetical protein